MPDEQKSGSIPGMVPTSALTGLRMSRLLARVSAFLFTIVLVSLASTFAEDKGYSLAEAEKVLQAIDTVQKQTGAAPQGRLRQISLTESELNSYIAYRIETEKEEIMKELRLKLFEGNKIEGKIHVDLRGQNIPQFIRPEIDFFFAADLRVADGLVRFDIKELFLESQPIQPFLLDLIIAVSARLNHQEATSINDWYELPYGINDIKTYKGRAVFYY